MTKKISGYASLAGIFLCLLLLAACAPDQNGTASVPTITGVKPSPTVKVSPTVKAQPSPTATATPVEVVIPPKPTVGVQPTTPPVIIPTTPPVIVPTPTTPPPPVTSPNPGVPAAAAAVLTQINQERASMGLKALSWRAGLQTSAHQHNLTMQAANQLSHQLPGEAAFGDRERAAGINWMSAGENIGEGSGDPTNAAVGLNTMMFNETPPDDGHRQNILSTSSNVVGIDVLVDNTNNKVWLTEDFAQI